MALPASGAISFSELRTEFVGGAAAVQFSDFYRSIAWPDHTTTENNTGVPTSGEVSLSDFHGGLLKPNINYIGYYTCTPGGTVTFAPTLASTTKAVIVTSSNRDGGFTSTNVTNIAITGVGNMTEIISHFPPNMEYRSDSAIFACNDVGSGSKTFTVTFTGNSSTDFFVYEIDTNFSTFPATQSDSVAGVSTADTPDPLPIDVQLYANGLAIVSWFSYNTPGTIPAPFTLHIGSGGGSYGAASAHDEPASDVGLTTYNVQDGAGANDGQSVVSASWELGKFTY